MTATDTRPVHGTSGFSMPLAPALPRASTTAMSTAFVVASLLPSLLPRGPLAQAMVTGMALAVALGVVWLIRRAATLVVRQRDSSSGARVTATALGTVLVAAAIVNDDRWQNSLRVAMGEPPTSLAHWPTVVIGSAVVTALFAGTARGMLFVARRLGLAFCAAAIVIGAMLTQTVIGPAVWRAATATFAATNDFVDTGIAEPTSTARSGSPQSLIAWDTLGSEGRKFVVGGDDSSTVRSYVGLESAPTPTRRITLAVDELTRAGGFDTSAVVIAVPTGSGWIDSAAATGIDSAFGGSAAIVGVQYSMAPSWATFLFGRAGAETSARELFDAVSDRIAHLPPEHPRPKLYVYGQSLGSVGGSSIFRSAADLHSRTCGALWAGPPGGAVQQDGATVIAHTSDPVVWWSSRLLMAPPDLTRAVVDAPVPAWLPVITYLQTTVDVIGATGTPTGHGHRYGTEQGTRLGVECPAANTSDGRLG